MTDKTLDAIQRYREIMAVPSADELADPALRDLIERRAKFCNAIADAAAELASAHTETADQMGEIGYVAAAGAQILGFALGAHHNALCQHCIDGNAYMLRQAIETAFQVSVAPNGPHGHA